jgi:hypothetical protein
MLMAKKTSKTAVLTTLEYPVKVEIRAADFEPYSSLQYIDVSKLSKGNHKLEVGLVKGGCCGLKAFAIIKAGMVVAVKFDPCLESKKPLSKNHQAMVDAAYKKIVVRPKWVPVSVEALFGKPVVSARLGIWINASCLQICWGDFTPESPRVCITCCSIQRDIVCDISRTVQVKL